jgi:hypothetical protein
MNEWNIQSRAHACQSCGQTFANKQPYHTLLFDDRQQFRREDVCHTCWQTQFSQGASDRKGFVSYWQGVHEAPPATPPDPIQKDTAEILLRKLIELNDPEHGAATYILAVMLERRRVLKVKEQFVREGQRVFIYEHPRSGDIFPIADPNLQLDQLDAVQHDVAALLEHGLDPPAAEAPGAPLTEAATSAEATADGVTAGEPAGVSATATPEAQGEEPIH